MAYGDSAADSLAAVRTAIAACLSAQSYTVRNRGKVMAELRELRKLEKELQDEASGSSSMTTLALPTRVT